MRPGERQPIDRRVIDQLVLEHLPPALAFATRLTGDAAAAEEVVQDALVRVLRRWRTYRGESPFRTWFFRIVVNTHRDQHRRGRPEQTLAFDAPGAEPEPAEAAQSSELAERVRAEIDRLPPRQREVAVTCLAEGASPSEAAEILGITESNVNTTLHAVRKRLAAAVGIDPVTRHA